MGKYTTMKTKITPIRLKKIPYYLFTALLTVGASLILGFLSFGGMFALFSTLSVAFISAALSVAYEGEIYLQNIRGAYNKLFKSNYLQNSLGKQFLLEHFPENIEDKNCPQFFKDYQHQLNLLATFSHKNLNAASLLRKKQVEKMLTDMEKWFAVQLFSEEEYIETTYATELSAWLKTHDLDSWQATLAKRSWLFNLVKVFSTLSAVFMGLSTTYLIVEAFSVIPFFATIPFALWPIIILPMAAIAGVAYGMLTYNAVTDLISNDTINTWYLKLRKDMSEGLTLRNVAMATATVFLGLLAVGLTVCTAGTWWTIANQARPLFEWMKLMPSFVMGVINPVITGFSALFFITQNTAESLEMVDNWLKGSEHKNDHDHDDHDHHHDHCHDHHHVQPSLLERLRSTENWAQLINPFRLMAKLIITPLRFLLFIGHLISIAVTADRLPGVPQMVAALIAFISEGFEDWHYFSFTDHEEAHSHHHGAKALRQERLGAAHGHSHDGDIPTQLIYAAAYVLFIPAACWDYLFSQFNTPADPKAPAVPNTPKQPAVLDFNTAWKKQCCVRVEEDVLIDSKANQLSEGWQKQHALALIDKYKKSQLNTASVGKGIAREKLLALNELQETIEQEPVAQLGTILAEAQKNPIYNKHRLFALVDSRTETSLFVDKLVSRCA